MDLDIVTNSVKNTEIESSEPEQARPFTRFEQMLEAGIWTNRLDKRMKMLFAEYAASLRFFDQGLERLSNNSSDEVNELITSMKKDVSYMYKDILPEIVQMSANAADTITALDSLAKERNAFAEDARKRSELLEEVLTRSIFEKIARLFKLGIYSKKNSLDKGPASSRAYKGCFDVNNGDSAFSIFNKWASVFHIDGKRYGSSTPTLHDGAENIVQFHQHFSLKDKTVLELGPFEGAKTKQIIELGAKHVHGIEANPEAFLKCLVLKNELRLDNDKLSLVYGDFNSMLSREKLQELPEFDCCVASGILYHMDDPLYTIDLITASAPVAYVWSQVASEIRPKTPWVEIKDMVGRSYQARENVYDEENHWGGIASNSFWLSPDSMKQAFRDRGFTVTEFELGHNAGGQYISFMARSNRHS